MGDLLKEVASYYSARLADHGQTARGVDWNGEEGQNLRFEQLARIIDLRVGFSINDLGCGYGALLDFLRLRFDAFSYAGFDISEPMVEAARSRHASQVQSRFVAAASPDHEADFGIASGIFNVRLNWPTADWQAYLESTLETLAATSRRGFAFNCLTSYSDAEKQRDDLFYADPRVLFDLCKRRFSRNVALLHDYGLYEFTILVRKAV